ncbi:hypothetical protein MPDQ_001165 [Monascus purpureus]|uniref:Flavin-nucleotide-binding protein n=1 Tax=Monascus purpureus TaxID=5098 RepID=A0A507R410_MONPU|nr:hypothetical protein MPDQ_001165 [Monascus purpureus]BDD61438.1 hypothetical protein MAP00_006482 [Monascus purpureus]
MEPSTLRRQSERATYDVNAVAAIFSDSFFAHVSYVDEGLPQCLPMIALFRVEGDGGNENAAVYLHGHPSTRLMELVRSRASEGREATDPLRVCITATKVDGLVLSSAPNGHTFNYRSSVIHGACSLVTDRDQKRDIMRQVTNHIVAGRWEEVNPVSSFQVSLVTVVRVDVQKGSLKTRSGIPGIQPRDVEKDGPDREEPVWTGVVPLYEHLDAPVASGLTSDAQVPESLKEYIWERNEMQKTYAVSAARNR